MTDRQGGLFGQDEGDQIFFSPLGRYLSTRPLELGKEKRVEVPIPMESREQLFEEQEGKCANPSCQTKITLCGKSCHCDHIIPRADGGSNDLDNLQLLCVTCHLEKCAAEKEGGYGNFCPDYHSQFSPSVYEHVLSHIHPLAFVELTDAAIKPMKDKISRNKEKVVVIFAVQKDTSGQEILDNITKGSITYEKAIKSLEMLDEIYSPPAYPGAVCYAEALFVTQL